MPKTLERFAVTEPQLGTASGYVTTELDDAATATLFTPDSCVFVSLRRSPRGRWMFDASDYVACTPALERARWASPALGFAAVAAVAGVELETVQP